MLLRHCPFLLTWIFVVVIIVPQAGKDDSVNKTQHRAFSTTHTLQETADMLGITRERVRQIEKKALDKIRRALKKKYAVDSLDRFMWT